MQTWIDAIATVAKKSPLASILLVTVACWSPYFSSTVVPFHDSVFIYECFHYLYSEALFNHELARWVPYGNYGIQADLIQGAVPPTGAVVGLVGLIFQLENTLVLAKAAVLLHETIYAFGLYLLGRELYSRRLTQILITLAGVLSVSWLQQLFLNLNVFYLLPLVMYCLVRFFKTGSFAALCLAGLIEVCSVVGGVPYFAPLHALLLTIFSIPLALQHSQSLRSLFNPRHLGHPCLWILVAVSIRGAPVSGRCCTRERHVIVPGSRSGDRLGQARDVSQLRPPVGCDHNLRLCNRGHSAWRQYVLCRPVVAGPVWLRAVHGKEIGLHRDCQRFRHAVLAVDRRCFRQGRLSFPGNDSLSAYRPGVRRCEHAAVAGIWIRNRPVVVLALGDSDAQRSTPAAPLGLAGPDCRPDVGRFIAAPATGRTPNPFAPSGLDALVCISTFDLPDCDPVAVCAVANRLAETEVDRSACIGAGHPVDDGSGDFSRPSLLDDAHSAGDGKLPEEVFEADGIPYLPQRTWQPPSSLAEARFQVFTRAIQYGNDAHYSILYGVVRMDPCRPNYRTDLLTPGIFSMIEARGGLPEPFPREEFLPRHDQPFVQALGCNADKIRLVDRALVATDESEARRLFASLPDPNSTIVLLSDGPKLAATPEGESRAAAGTVQVEEFTSNRIKLRVGVESAGPAWLVYADAWHPDWKAHIDGRDVPVVRANLGFKAVRVEPGATREVEFEYRSRRTWLAWCHVVVATASGLALCFALVLTVGREIRNSCAACPPKSPFV